MSFGSGTRLGAYEVITLVGQGGMGHVYRARDTRLDREVAIKVLPDHLNADPDFRQRFDREARAISQLTHPHICTLYDVGEENGHAFFVMELLSGETLAERLARGPLPVEDALRLAIQIADALSSAHAAGIVHRDLKPGNVMLTKTGVKLLDFGLAKTGVQMGPVPGFSLLPTTPPVAGAGGPPLTGVGTILGTFQYMAPEQVEGLEADTRTDIFAFGTVLYEMLTGRKAFEASSQASLIAAILERQPPAIQHLQPLAPASLAHVVNLCLAKARDERWQSIRDVREQLRWIVSAGAASDDQPIATRVAPRRRAVERIAWFAAIVMAAAATAAVMRSVAERPARPIARLTIPMPPTAPIFFFEQAFAISPDGTRVAYRGSIDSGRSSDTVLYIRSLDADAPVALKGADGPEAPFFSPDGKWVAFFSGAKLRKIPAGGGVPLEICEVVSTGRGGTWGPDDTIVFATADVDFAGLLRVSAAGGKPERVATPERGVRYAWPTFLPDGKTILYTSSSAVAGVADTASIMAKRLDTGEEHVVFSGGSQPRYIPDGHLVVARGNTLLAMPFDVKTLTAGNAVAVLDGIMNTGSTGGIAQYDVSTTGTIVYTVGSSNALDREVVWVNRRGEATAIPGLRQPFNDVSISPDAKTLALSLGGTSRNIWTFDLEKRTLSRLTFGAGNDQIPRWTPDGRRIAFSSPRDGPYQIYWKAADGSGGEDLLVKADAPGQFPRSFSPDGRLLLYERGTAAAANDLYVATVDGTERPTPFVATPANETVGQFSPDGRWVAYQSNESGRYEVYVKAFPDRGGRWQVSNEGGELPHWRGDGRELFYRTRSALMSVAVTAGSAFAAGSPQELFAAPFEMQFDVQRDGQRFLMLKSAAASTPVDLNIVLNWSEDLRQRLGPN